MAGGRTEHVGQLGHQLCEAFGRPVLVLRLFVMEDLVEPHDVGVVRIDVDYEELGPGLLFESVAVAMQRIEKGGATALRGRESHEHASAARGERLAQAHASSLRRREQSHLSQPRRSALAPLGQ